MTSSQSNNSYGSSNNDFVVSPNQFPRCVVVVLPDNRRLVDEILRCCGGAPTILVLVRVRVKEWRTRTVRRAEEHGELKTKKMKLRIMFHLNLRCTTSVREKFFFKFFLQRRVINPKLGNKFRLRFRFKLYCQIAERRKNFDLISLDIKLLDLVTLQTRQNSSISHINLLHSHIEEK